jgi:energy-coupling factor transporter ATP-binding protein EcfA2
MNWSADHCLSSGSRWHRWEPHIHAPGTILNDQFGGPEEWEKYLVAVETAFPPIQAIGVTDYYSTESYERMRQAKLADRLPNCDLIFPNVEMRLGVGTVKGSWVNIHLLVSPEDPEHVAELKRFLARLTFQAFDDSFCCSRDDFIRLGQRSDPSLRDAVAALEHGSKQFKVSLDELKEEYRASAWAQANILVAVAGSMTDGSSGVRDPADATLRQEIEKFAHVIFASSVEQREFWLGERAIDAEGLRQRYSGLKPCLHGSDAHDHKAVGLPAGSRYSWIKGAVEFDSLRQACIEPACRAYVGEQPPMGATPSQVIQRVKICGAPWLQTPCIALNPGLVAIVGARGSGKTALAEIIAAGCDAISERPNKKSFLTRARGFLAGASVKIDWETADEPEVRALDGSDTGAPAQYARARFLSQQFVEDLCASDGMTDALLRELERVIFEAHGVTALDGPVDFDELLELRATRHRQARMREEEALSILSDRIGTELEKNKLVPRIKSQIHEKSQLIARYTADRSKLVSQGSEERIARVAALNKAADKVRGYLRSFNVQEQTLLAMQDEVADFRQNRAPEALRGLRERHASSGVKDEDWMSFLLDYSGKVDGIIASQLTQTRTRVQDWKGTLTTALPAPETPLIGTDAELELFPLALLGAEIARLEKLIGVDRDTANKFSALSKRIVEETTTLESLKEKLSDFEQAMDRASTLVKERQASYARVFEAIVAEQAVLTDLYSPLMTRLAAAEGTLNRLSFTVTREADIERWANEGEQLLDLRRQGPFKGRGTLRQRAEATLKSAWEIGAADAVSAAMVQFREENQKALLEHSPVPASEEGDYRAWSKNFARWLYSTAHIAVRYSVDYDGVDIRNLSPGTRGIVLLLLYLALDDSDDRPLIIDQPEENLDPKSVFDELVKLFLQAKMKRQVIIVTHNANLVINTDADQIIVANCGPNPAGSLPPISYISGGLESAHIRKAVCDILEGGENAFKERARRLRVRLER